jgi:hypothetical protein
MLADGRCSIAIRINTVDPATFADGDVDELNAAASLRRATSGSRDRQNADRKTAENKVSVIPDAVGGSR